MGSERKGTKSCVLHAGFHKTGTTAIQRAMQGYFDGQTAYANLGAHNHSIALGFAFPGVDLMPDSAVMERAVAKETRAQITAALQRDCDRILFSAEHISTMHEEDMVALRDLIARHCDPIDVVVFVRAPLDWTASLIQQALKMGRPCDLEPFRGRIRQRLERLERVFGTEHVRIERYEEKSAHGEDVVALFADILGLRVEQVNRTETKANVSLPLATTRALYQLRQVPAFAEMLRHVPKARNAFVDAMSRLDVSGTPLDPLRFAEAVDVADYTYLNTRIDQPYDLDFPPGPSARTYLTEEDPDLLRALNQALLDAGVLKKATDDHAFALSLFFVLTAGQVFERRL